MTPHRTAELLNRMPHWFMAQVRDIEARSRQRQLQWEETRRLNDAQARQVGSQRLAAAHPRFEGRGGWHDTVIDLRNH